ncbi:MAG: galactokinase, partial [Desulfobacterales bacterium]
LQLTYSKEKVPLGTGGALRLALPYLRSDPILVMNGDSFIDVDIDAYLEWFSKKKRLASILLKNVPDTGRYGRVVFDSNGIINSFEEKGSNIGVGWINAGIYILQKSLIADMPSTKQFSLEHDFFPKLVGHGLYGYCSNGAFIDIGTPETYAQAENFFKERYF